MTNQIANDIIMVESGVYKKDWRERRGETMRKKFLTVSLIVFSMLLFGCNHNAANSEVVYSGAENEAESEKVSEEVSDKMITIIIGEYDDDQKETYFPVTGLYTGRLYDGIPDGYGSFTAETENGTSYTYTGNFEKGRMNGQGKTIWENLDYIEEGTYTQGLYTPTRAEMICSYGKAGRGYGTFDVSQDSMDFITEHESIFPTSSESEAVQFVNGESEVRKLKKTTSGFDTSFIYLENTTVIQVFEVNYGGYTITELLVEDYNGDIISVYYPDKIDYYEDDVISKIYALPLANASFENVSGGTTLCVAMFGSYIS